MNKKTSLIGKIKPYLYLLPSTIIILVMLGFPIGYNIGISFFKWTLMSVNKPFDGLNNYISVIKDYNFINLVAITLVWTILGVLLQMVVGISMALFAEHLHHGQKYMRTIMLLPWIIPGVVTALMWKWLLQADIGVINDVLLQSGIIHKNILFLADPHYALITLILVNTWKAAPFWFLMITAGLQGKPVDQIESATIDGASYFLILRKIILPYLTPIIASTGVLTTIWTLNYFDLIWTTTGGGPMNATSTLPVYTYRLAFEFSDFGRSAALAVVSLIIVIIVCIPYLRQMFSNLKEEGVLS
jgi:ABC-type sugar transport systems, permease components